MVILLGLLLLMFFAYLGWSIIWVAPVVATFVAYFSGLDVLPTYADVYMGGFVDFAAKWFPIFLLGAIFGKLMEDTGAAKSLAQRIAKVFGSKRAILGVLVACAILTYGGVSLFVVVFAIYPLAIALFREANVSRNLLPATIALGAFTFTMTAIPGTPQIQNLIPTDTFRTDAMAGSIIGIVSGLIMAVGGYLWLAYRDKKLKAKGEGFTEPTGWKEERNDKPAGNFVVALLPLLVVVFTLNILKWEPIISLLIGIVSIFILNAKQYKTFVSSVNEGAKGSVMAVINTSAAVGFGSVITAVPEFKDITNLLLNVSNNPLVSEGLSVQVLAMITGSASGGMGIALQALGDTWYQLSQTGAVSADALHRIASVASGASILPHNGALLTLLAVTGLRHKKTYKDVFVVALIIPTLALVVGIMLAAVGIV